MTLQKISTNLTQKTKNSTFCQEKNLEFQFRATRILQASLGLG